MGKDQKARSMINLIALELNKDEDRFFEDEIMKIMKNHCIYH